MTVIHRVIISSHNNHPTDDFTTVWSALHRFVTGAAVYTEDYTNDDPHYLYSPGGTLLLSPLGLVPSGVGRNLLILGDAVAILLALALLTVLVGRRLTGPVLPIAVFLVFATESVTNTLLFSNINGVLFLVEVVFLWLLLADRGELATRGSSRWAGLLAGVAIGLAITVKPQFVVLLFLPLVRRQWAVLSTGVAVPVLFTAVGWILVPDTATYVDTLLPYLNEVRDYANSSIAGVGAHYGWPSGLVLVVRAATAIAVAVGVLGLLWWRQSSPFMWAATTSAILLAGVFMVSSLGQMYYSMLLVPMLFTVLCRRSVMHGAAIWFGVYCCLSWDEWMSDRWPRIGEIFHYSFGTIGWGIIIVTAAITVVVWLRQARQESHEVGVSALIKDLITPGDGLPENAGHAAREQSGAHSR